MPTGNESSELASTYTSTEPAEISTEPIDTGTEPVFHESTRYRPAPTPFRIASVPGVTITKWTRIWAERFRWIPLEFLAMEANPAGDNDQAAIIRLGLAEVSFVRLPVDRDGLSVIPLYHEVPVVVFGKEHDFAAADTVDLSELADERILEPIEDSFELSAAGVGVIIAPHSIARLYNRKDVLTRPLTGVEPTEIALVWSDSASSDEATERINEFIGIVRGRGANSSRGTPTPPTDKKAARKKAAAALAKSGTKSGSGQSGSAKGRGGSSGGKKTGRPRRSGR